MNWWSALHIGTLGAAVLSGCVMVSAGVGYERAMCHAKRYVMADEDAANFAWLTCWSGIVCCALTLALVLGL